MFTGSFHAKKRGRKHVVMLRGIQSRALTAQWRSIASICSPTIRKNTLQTVRSVLTCVSHVYHGYGVLNCRALTSSRALRTSSCLDSGVIPGGAATGAEVDQKGRRSVHVKWNDGISSEYPAVWLRDNCQCESCFHPVSKARLSLLCDLDPQIQPASVQVDAIKGQVKVTWPDGHVSPFSFEWLRARSFSQGAYRERTRAYPTKVVTWNASDLQDKVSKVKFQQLLEDDQALYRWICGLEETGIYLVTDAPCEVAQLHRIGDRVAFLRKTNYGPTFQVHSKLDPSNLAYTSGTLSLHTDLAYYNYQPGMQMLHCIAQVPTEGGENIFVDGFRAAEILKAEYPEYFRLLTSYVIDFYDIGDDYYKFHQLTRELVIRVSPLGDVDRINYSQHGRDSFMNALPLEAVTPYYNALRTFDDILHDPKNTIKMKLRDGDIVCLHNYRVLHGRTSYKVTEEGQRHLEGGYIDWDEMHSRKRVLMEELAQNGFTHF